MTVQSVNNAGSAISALALNAGRFNIKAAKFSPVKPAEASIVPAAEQATKPSRPNNLLRELAQNVKDLRQVGRADLAQAPAGSARSTLTEFKNNLKALSDFIKSNPEQAEELSSLRNRLITQARQALNDVRSRTPEEPQIDATAFAKGKTEAAESLRVGVDIKV